MAEKTVKNPNELTEKGMALVEFMRANGDGMTAKEIADQMGITAQSVNGTFTSLSTSRDKKGLEPIGYREEVSVEGEDGKVETIKLLKLTDYGKNADLVVKA